MREEERKGRLGEASVASRMGPEHQGPGPRQDGARLGRGARAELGQKPGAGTHGASRRRGLLCSAYPWGGRGAGGARLPPPFRLSNSTSGLEEKREGWWGVGVSGRPAAAGRTGAGDAALISPRGLLPGRLELATAVPATSHRRGSGLVGQQHGPEAAGRAGGIWGRMARAAAAARTEAGSERRLAQLPGTRSSERQQPERARSWGGSRLGSRPLQVPASWRSCREVAILGVSERAPSGGESAGRAPAP